MVAVLEADMGLLHSTQRWLDKEPAEQGSSMLHLHVCGPVGPLLVNGVCQSQCPLQRGVKLKPALKLYGAHPNCGAQLP